MPVLIPHRRHWLLPLLLLLLVVFSGIWVWHRAARTIAPPAAVPTATVSLAGGATPAPSLTPAPPPAYRLAGVALGEPESFAVIEAPHGATELSRRNDEVPGLGRLLRIDAERVVVQGDAEEVELWLMPAATATPAVTRIATRRAPTAVPARRVPTAGTTPGSGSSAAPGPPAS